MNIQKCLKIIVLSTAFFAIFVTTSSWAVELNGTVIAVDGMNVAIEVKLIEPFSPAVGNRVDLIKTADGGRVELDIGDWQVTEVTGTRVKAEAINALGTNPPKVNMKAIIHLSPGPVHAGPAPAPTAGKKSPAATGKVIMKRGQNITIKLSKGKQAVAQDDIAKLSFSSGDEEIPVGTWRVTRINDNGTVEAEPLDVMGEANIDMDAQIFASGIKLDLKKNNALAWAYFKGEGQSQDDRKAFDLFMKGCNGGHMANCVTLAWMYEKGRGIAKDEVRAAELYQKGCDGGNAEGCVNLGRMYENGGGVVQDYKKAVELYEKGCREDHLVSCNSLALMYAQGSGVETNYGRALNLFQKSCDGNYAMGCGNLGIMYSRGWGVTKDSHRAAELYEKACNAGENLHCGNLGLLYAEGRGVTKDQRKAIGLLEKGCSTGKAVFCNKLNEIKH